MWPFRRRKQALVDSVRLGEIGDQMDDYPILTVGQSRLGDSFLALGFTPADPPRFCWAQLSGIVDPGMDLIADVEIRIEGNIVGYLRPPALDAAIAQLAVNRALQLEVPVVIVSTPAGPEVRVHRSLS